VGVLVPRTLHPVLLCSWLLLAGGCERHASVSPTVAASSLADVTSLESIELQKGAGEPIKAGQKAAVQYTGWLYEASAADKKGKEFDSSQNSGQPFKFTLGAGEVIKGWDQGIAGMKVAERRRLIIPPALGYGDAGAGDGVIPPGATLVFDVELVGIE
jgi:FKBP-type peptidyl-prolyl cis-trans isomerase